MLNSLNRSTDKSDIGVTIVLIHIIFHEISTNEYGGLNLRLPNLSHALYQWIPPLRYLKKWSSHYLSKKKWSILNYVTNSNFSTSNKIILHYNIWPKMHGNWTLYTGKSPTKVLIINHFETHTHTHNKGQCRKKHKIGLKNKEIRLRTLIMELMICYSCCPTQ